MTLEANSRFLNIQRSFNKWLHIKLVTEPSSPRCFINYSEIEGKVPQGTNSWITIFWISLPKGIHTYARIQINVMGKIQNDLYGNLVSSLIDYVTEALNYNTIPLYDFSDTQNIINLTPYCLIPRYEETGKLPFPEGATIRGYHLDYLLHMSRDGIVW